MPAIFWSPAKTTANTVLAGASRRRVVRQPRQIAFRPTARRHRAANSAGHPSSNYVTEFADAVKTAEIGALVGPVKTQFGYHIIQVRAREDREMSDSDYEQALNTEFDAVS